VLTKIFVVLVSVLAVLLVPLVVVYAHNEDSFKSRYERAQAQKDVATSELAQAEARQAAELNRLQVEIDAAVDANARLEQARVEADAETRRLQSLIAAEQAMKTEIDSKLATLSTAMKSSQDLTSDLVTEVRGLRGDKLTLERQKAELDEALRDVSGQLEVAVQARRALQEEIQRIKDELAEANSTISSAIAQGFDPTRITAGVVSQGRAPTRNLDATVIDVIRTGEQVLAEIDAGQRDGVEEGWILSVGRGSSFRGKLRIIRVDVNRATGIITLEDPLAGRQVQVGDTAFARMGID
jgi:predicted  nucleic acid-binding Zn-ribbon protein